MIKWLNVNTYKNNMRTSITIIKQCENDILKSKIIKWIIKIKTIKWRGKIAEKHIFKQNERNIFINYESNIAISTNENSYIAKCENCEKILGFINYKNKNFMLFKEKVKY